MSSYYPAKRKAPESYTTEFDILKASHKFLRSGEDSVAASWDAQLAKKYEDSLFKEFAICDLKHYKSGNIALRWRTEDEVLSGTGEETCGNTRCPYYGAPRRNDVAPDHSQDINKKLSNPPKLTTMELPFSYTERGETQVREAMVKVVLCERCAKKLMWKREKDRKQRFKTKERTSPEPSAGKASRRPSTNTEEADKEKLHVRNGRRSRSRSPRRRREQ